MVLQIPTAMEAEHEELHDDLSKAIGLSGQTGEAAQKVASALHEHFKKEERIALPPLGLLMTLSKGDSSPDMEKAAQLAEQLEAELPTMLREHQRIVTALNELVEAARFEGHPDVIKFAERLKLHAETEEQVSYPAAILVGKYIRALALNEVENEAGLS